MSDAAPARADRHFIVPWWGWLCVCVSVVLAARLLEFREGQDQVNPGGGGRVVVGGVDWELPVSCAVRTVWGWSCPGCGLTRSFVLAADGNWRAAFGQHAAGTLLFAWLLLQIPLLIWTGMRRRPQANTTGGLSGRPSSGRWLLFAVSLVVLSFVQWIWFR